MSEWWEDQLNRDGAASALPALWTPRAVVPQTANPQDWWTYARLCARRYREGVFPEPVRVHGPVLRRDEKALVLAEGIEYSRLYGGDGYYTPANTWVVGRPAVMATAAVITATVNRRRKAAARREAEVRWRAQQKVAAIATDWRIMCNPEGQFISFFYRSVTEFHPDLSDWSMTLAFGDECSPLRLRGLAVPAMALWVGAAAYGADWVDDPRLAPLLA